MNHLEAQSYIMPFINGQIPPAKQEEFVMHMKSCSKCHEELEVYYILLNGMKQLDSNTKLSINFSADLDNKLNRLYKGAKGRNNIKLSAFSIFMAGILLVAAIVYATCISSVYSYEQRAKVYAQGEYYFSTNLSGLIIDDDTDRIMEAQQFVIIDEITNYERIRSYNWLRDQLLRIIEIGEELTHEATAN